MKIKLEAMSYDEWVILFNSYIAQVEEAFIHTELKDEIDKTYFEKMVVTYNLWLINKLQTQDNQ